MGYGRYVMSQINPFNWVAQAGQVHNTQSSSKERQIRRAQNLAKNTALTGDSLEHQVESSDAVQKASDHDPNSPERQNKQHKPHSDKPDQPEEPSLDLKA
jgi:hypothetical protein